jgi:hypothetical protein
MMGALKFPFPVQKPRFSCNLRLCFPAETLPQPLISTLELRNRYVLGHERERSTCEEMTSANHGFVQD